MCITVSNVTQDFILEESGEKNNYLIKFMYINTM